MFNLFRASNKLVMFGCCKYDVGIICFCEVLILNGNPKKPASNESNQRKQIFGNEASI